MPIISSAPGRRMRWKRICWIAHCALLLRRGIQSILFLKQMQLRWKSWVKCIFRPVNVRYRGCG